jgi:glycosyltransferase involved in cell wall biosynthesis
MTAVHFDITQLLFDPRRTGIQRVERELARHWPGATPLIPVRYNPHSDGLERLPDRVLEILCEDAPAGIAGAEAEVAKLAPHLARAEALDLRRHRVNLLQTELFGMPARAEFLQRLARIGGHDVAMLLHDFLPWLQPQFFELGAGTALMHYLRAVRATPRLCFVSEHTRRDWLQRITRGRGPDGPVFPEGGDGLRMERQRFFPERQGYIVLGTIEARKNVLSAIHAFEQLWQQGDGPVLHVVGRLDPALKHECETMQRLAGAPWLRHYAQASDEQVRSILRQVRAMIFPSEHEGFGLPPFESLHAGIPVIVHAEVPSISPLPPLGQIRLERCDPASIIDAVRLMETEAVATRLWEEAGQIQIPSWGDFARNIADWMAQGR